MTVVLVDQIDWGMSRDNEGHRDYNISWLLRGTTSDGPQSVMNAAGLPTPGTLWSYGNDNDPWAFCHPQLTIIRHGVRKGEPGIFWEAKQLFSTRPITTCQEESIEDPLLQPQRIRGSFVKFTRQAKKNWSGSETLDANGEPIADKMIEYSSHEPIEGPEVEITDNHPTVIIEQNKAVLGIATFSEMVDTLNDATLWGLDKRKIKLSNVSWERKVWGICDFYYTRVFEFEIDFNTWDRSVPDYGTKALSGHWDTEDNGTSDCSYNAWILEHICGAAPDPTNPQHFVKVKDRHGENMRIPLNGEGLPASTLVTPVGTGPESAQSTVAADIAIEPYGESNFLLLEIPTQLE